MLFRFSGSVTARVLSRCCAMLSDNEGLIAAKTATRKHVRAALRSLTAEDMHTQSIIKHAQRIGVYVTCAKLREVDTSALLVDVLNAGNRCYVPLVDDKASNMRLLHTASMEELVSAPPFGILEPPPAYPDGTPREDVMEMDSQLQVLLMPGLAFDSHGNRLGRGGGYYDKLVSRLLLRHQQQGWERPLLVGLAFAEQLLPEVAAGQTDQRVDVVVVPSGVIRCTERGQGL